MYSTCTIEQTAVEFRVVIDGGREITVLVWAIRDRPGWVTAHVVEHDWSDVFKGGLHATSAKYAANLFFKAKGWGAAVR